MLSSPPYWRIGLMWAVFAGVLAACGSNPTELPSRAGFPGKLPATEPTPTLEDAKTDARDMQVDTLDRALFAATRAALANGDWLGATLALPQREPHSGSSPLQDAPGNIENSDAVSLWTRYYTARIELLRGDTQSYTSSLGALKSKVLPLDLRREILFHELEIAQRENNSGMQLELSLRLLALATPDTTANLEATLAANPEVTELIWNAAQRLSNAKAAAPRANTLTNPTVNAWLDLARATSVSNALDSAAALSAWEAQYDGHAAFPIAAALRAAALRDAQTTKLSLILPLSGPLEKAGIAVSQGFIAAFYADTQTNLSIDVLDSRRFDTIKAAYGTAQQNGANLIVGPLGKRQVEELLGQADLNVPVLTLNRPEAAPSVNPSALLLSLAPEDEARQLAEDAFAGGARRALVIRPQGEWGERMEFALAQRWRQLGGQIPAAAVYGKPSTHSTAIRDALGLGDSAQRSTALRALFNDKVETTGRRRVDLDAVFLLSKSSDEARALKPLINYHYAGGLPVYALSTADSGSGNTSLNRDLGGLRILAMPWRLNPDALTGIDPQSNSAALHALGEDAYALARRWWRMRSTAAPLYFGLTAEVQASADGSLQRRLNLAEFDRGALRPR